MDPLEAEAEAAAQLQEPKQEPGLVSGQALAAVRNGFGGARVLVVGDLMLDRYLWGQVGRISPEAPVPVLHLGRETETAGGAANVARNLIGLGLRVSIAGVTGEDENRQRLLRLLAEQGAETSAVLADPSRPTTTKTRLLGNHQQMLRIDAERLAPLSAELEDRLFGLVLSQLSAASVLLLSDYAKGVLFGGLCQRLIGAAREQGVPVLVDPKGSDFSRYLGASVITPNRAELAQAARVDPTDLERLTAIAGQMRADLRLDRLVLTLGELGLLVVEPDRQTRIPAVAREVFDVSGAGDTVIATLAAGLAAGLDPIDSAHLANLAAGVVVAKVGTAAVSLSELEHAISDEAALEQAAKLCSLTELQARVRSWQSRGERVVFTNGCFDLLHAGHVTYLERARRHGQRLIIGLNSDRSVRALKGPERPLIAEQDRARVLAALAAVDAVVLFDEDTPLKLIEALRPDVLAKGADYQPDQVVGAEQVRGWGGELVLVPLLEERSTSGIIRRMQG
ncbi:D-glycero-beta-D-manno-heptose-7-phosphate kinase [Lamprobacter modestohalophilus]|uniref:D-glycero-beta-D-manno-heptose-7-phosphate kinase n=1 Tax=Lamprobacter modestohalophilus TaxID=1064514 RepID=UPI002ADEBEB9|nr:D-glycero-beta-D-manno-heptose-7-phosphate kinase [Lamprobacter modestohalophilus]MEA1049668.1 D-glycero-beta-D-manno-heptose-7-phosphate kinase [Lamprobacter modestohalophilus]